MNRTEPIQVTVHLGTILQKRTAGGNQRKLEVCLPVGACLEDLIRELELAIEPDHLLLAVNGRTAQLATMLAAGDRVHLMMPISGG